MNNVFFSGLVAWGQSFINWIANIGQGICESISGMSEATETALIGVLGTLLGTLLGWWLNSLSQKGKLSFYVATWEDKFEHNELGEMVRSSDKAEARLYSCKMALDIYNSSADTKIMRNVQFVFAGDDREIRVCTPNDQSSERFVARTYRYDKIGPINIPPKTVINVVLSSYEWDKDNSLKDYWGINNIYLRYTDEKNKTHKIPIVQEDYNDYFLNHKVEEE